MDPSESSWDDVVVVGRYDVLQANEGNILPQDQDTIDQVRTWLHPTGYEDEGSEYHKHLSSHLSGTGAWLLNSSSYQQWHGGDEYGMLWLRGKLICAGEHEQSLIKYRNPWFRKIGPCS